MEQNDTSETLTELFRRFPGIGQRQAQRFTDFIARSDAGYIGRLTDGITDVHAATKQCPECFIHHMEPRPVCGICSHDGTDTCIVVEKDADAHAIRRTMHDMTGTCYFILGGLVAIVDNTPKPNRIPRLITRLREKNIREVIIALSVHPDAEHTMRFISDAIRAELPDIRITIPGRGLSSGSELEYSDPETLTNALRRRDSV